jgi:hypothetical protein
MMNISTSCQISEFPESLPYDSGTFDIVEAAGVLAEVAVAAEPVAECATREVAYYWTVTAFTANVSRFLPVTMIMCSPLRLWPHLMPPYIAGEAD